MWKPVKPVSQAARERLTQVRNLLEVNGVPKPPIIFMYGKALIPFMKSIEKEFYHRTGPIRPDDLYRYNLDTGRFYKVEPRTQP